jgi:hypothetical protein
MEGGAEKVGTWSSCVVQRLHVRTLARDSDSFRRHSVGLVLFLDV